MYLCVDNMERALGFYKKFFEKEPLITDELYSIFDVNGFRLGLFDYRQVNETHTFGSNCIPSIEVDSLKTLNEKINGLEICFPITKIGYNWVAEFIDSEGNHIEITAPVKD